MNNKASITSSGKFINLDWLSVYCIEPKGEVMDANYYKELGWKVEIQPYGTTIYAEKFKLMNGKHVYLEIERNPYSLRKNGGIFEEGACHIRLSNRTCYQYDAISQLRDFIAKYNYQYKGISRIDICCDFIKFDNGMKPQKLANDYMAEKAWKVHQSSIYAHTYEGDDSSKMKTELGAFGKETKRGRMWNSLKWGSNRSPISTKLYNKTLELANNTGKYYIKDAWVKAGIIDLQKVTYQYHDQKTGKDEIRSKHVCVAPGTSVPEAMPIEDVEIVDVWRVEFSITTEGRSWVDIERGKRIKLDLCAFDNKENQTYTFFTCAEWLFCFVKAEYYTGKNGKEQKQRTNRCHHFQLFNTKFLRHTYKPQRLTENEDASRTEKLIMNRLMKKAESEELSEDMRRACVLVAQEINAEHKDWYLPDSNNPYIKTAIEDIAKRKKQSEEAIAQSSASAEDWILKQDDGDSLKTLNRNSNRWRKHQQLVIQNERKRVIACYNILKNMVERYKRLVDRGDSLPPYIENILGTPF